MNTTSNPEAEPALSLHLRRSSVALWLFALMAIAVYLDVTGVSHYAFNADEWVHVSIAGAATLGEVLRFTPFDTHPPLGYVLLHYWMMQGSSDAYIRAFALLFGLALIPLYYAIGKRLAGEMAGLICAALVTFSKGVIIQSFIVRDYTLFLFLLSCGFYCFIGWHRSGSKASLLAYTSWCMLACLTHFSGIFAASAIAAGECIYLFCKKAPAARQVQWALVNLLILLTEAAAVYYNWRAGLAPEDVQHALADRFNLLLFAAVFPLNALYYIAPSRKAAIGLLLLFPLVRELAVRELKSLLMLAAVAIFIGIALVASGLYPYGPSRHNLWILPFYVSAAGWLLSEAFSWLAMRFRIRAFAHLALACLCAIGYGCYSPSTRFASNGEYTLSNSEWQRLTHYAASLDSHSLIVTERADAFMLAPAVPIYPYLASPTGYALVPYGHTRLLFRTLYNRFDGHTLFHLLEDAKGRGGLDGVDTLVFIRSSITRSAILPLELCAALDKQLIIFSDTGIKEAAGPGEVMALPAVALVVSKRSFFEKLAGPSGPAHSCLKDDN